MRGTKLKTLELIGTNFTDSDSSEIAKAIYIELDKEEGKSTEDILYYIKGDPVWSSKWNKLEPDTRPIYFMNALNVLERIELIRRKKDNKYYRT